jgi:Putative capsular polysaccharide synthesis protein
MPHGMPTDISRMIDNGSLQDLPPDNYLTERIRLIDFEFYRTAIHHGSRPDLIDLSRDELLLHNIKRGRIEGRTYNQRILQYLDTNFYKSTYPELGVEDEAHAQRHWLYDGVFQKKSPNSVTEQIKKACIHLFQMGKVGSKSIEKSLRISGHTEHIMHLHFANQMITSYPDCYYSYPEIIRDSPGNILFLTGVREPIGRILSGWIESTKSHESSMNLDHLNDLLDDPIGIEKELEKELEKDIDIITNWFDHNFYCGLDVFSKPFNQEKGYATISGDRHKVFVYTVEKLDDIWEVLSIFLGSDLRCVRINETKSKGSRELEFLHKISTIKLPQRIIEKAYDNQYSRHFWSLNDINLLKKKYTASA